MHSVWKGHGCRRNVLLLEERKRLQATFWQEVLGGDPGSCAIGAGSVGKTMFGTSLNVSMSKRFMVIQLHSYGGRIVRGRQVARHPSSASGHFSFVRFARSLGFGRLTAVPNFNGQALLPRQSPSGT